MNKYEFKDYVSYLERLFNTKINQDKDVLATYYKSFENINIITAKEMAEKYLTNETGYFKWAKLLEYKSMCLKGKTWYEEADKSKCMLCNGTGYVFVEEYRGTRVYEMGKRCTCKAGEELPKYIRQFDTEILNTHFQDHKGVFRIEKPKFIPVESKVINEVKGRMGVI